MLSATVSIRGTRALLMSRYDAEEMSRIEQLDPDKKRELKKKIPPPEEQAEKRAYRMENGELYIPGECVYACILNGADLAGWRLTREGSLSKSTGQRLSKYLKGALWVKPEKISLGTKKFTVDLRKVKQKGRGGQVIGIPRARPRVDKWKANFTIEWDPTSTGVEKDDMKELINRAGTYAGLLDFRPVFGTFEVEDFQTEEI